VVGLYHGQDANFNGMVAYNGQLRGCTMLKRMDKAAQDGENDGYKQHISEYEETQDHYKKFRRSSKMKMN